MEGLETNKGASNYTYLQIINGALALRCKEGEAGAVERVNKNGDKVFEKIYTGVTGKITLISISDEKYGKELHVVVKKGGNNFVVQTQASGGYAFGFLSRVPNIDFTREVQIRPFAIEDKETKKIKNFLVVYQNNEAGKSEKVAPFFTKDVPNDLPALEQITVKNKLVWDDTERIIFFENMIYAPDGVNDQLIKLSGVKQESTPDTFLDEINTPIDEVTEPLLGEDAADLAKAQAKQASKTPNADKAIQKAHEEGAKATAAKKAAKKTA